MRARAALLVTTALLAGCSGGSGPEDVAADFESAVQAKDGEKAFEALCPNDEVDRAAFVDAVATAADDETEITVAVGDEVDDDTYEGTFTSPGQESPDDVEFQRVDGQWCIAIPTS